MFGSISGQFFIQVLNLGPNQSMIKNFRLDGINVWIIFNYKAQKSDTSLPRKYLDNAGRVQFHTSKSLFVVLMYLACFKRVEWDERPLKKEQNRVERKDQRKQI